MTKKERILMAMRGETPDMLPYTPRFDLWYNSNSYRGTLPRRHQGRSHDEIARTDGYGSDAGSGVDLVRQLLKGNVPR